MVSVVEQLRKQKQVAMQQVPDDSSTRNSSPVTQNNDSKIQELMQKLQDSEIARERAEARAAAAEQKITTLQEQHNIVIEGMRENVRLAAARNMQLDETNIELKGLLSNSTNRNAELESSIGKLREQVANVSKQKPAPAPIIKQTKIPDFDFIPIYDANGRAIKVEARAKT